MKNRKAQLFLSLLFSVLICSCSSRNIVDKHSRINFVNEHNDIQLSVWVYAQCGIAPEEMKFQTISVHEGIVVYCNNGSFLKFNNQKILLNGALLSADKKRYVLSKGELLEGAILSYK